MIDDRRGVDVGGFADDIFAERDAPALGARAGLEAEHGAVLLRDHDDVADDRRAAAQLRRRGVAPTHGAGRDVERDQPAGIAAREIGGDHVRGAAGDHRLRLHHVAADRRGQRVTSGGASSRARAPTCAASPCTCDHSPPTGGIAASQTSGVTSTCAEVPLALSASTCSEMRAGGERGRG